MLNSVDFIKCIQDNLKDRRYGHKRIKEITEDFQARVNVYKSQGRDEQTASLLAMKDTFDNISERALEKAKNTAKMLSVQAENKARIAQAMDVNLSVFDTNKRRGEGKVSSRGRAIGMAALSLLEQDPRFAGLSYDKVRDATHRQLWALFGDSLDKVNIGKFGIQKGTAHLPNIIREIFGNDTGDKVAKDIANSWLKVSDVGVDLFNQAGGSMRKLSRYIPQSTNVSKLIKNGVEAFVDDHLRYIDWGKTRWPDGTLIDEADRVDLLKDIYETKSTDGASKIDETKFRGKGRALGRMLDNHRFLHYKDAESWLQMHEKYGDGNVFDVMTRHIADMAHRIAAVDRFGPSPDLTFNNIEAIARKQAAKLDPKERADLEATLQNLVKPVFDLQMRKNPMNPESIWGSIVTGLGHLSSAAMLGGATIPAALADFATSAVTRKFNGLPMFSGMDTYFKSIVGDTEFQRKISAQSGFINEQTVASMTGILRFNPVAEVGPNLTRRLSDTVLRANLLIAHTSAARWTIQSEFMGALSRMKGDTFDKLPFSHVMERYGITAKDWDDFRNGVKDYTPREGVAFLRPIDILDTKLKNKQLLYQKFQSMILQEAEHGVPDNLLQSRVRLKGTTNPDTLVGTIAYSFGTFKNFPMSFYTLYGRLGITSPNAQGRLGFYAGLGAATTLAGAMALQMREVSKGRDPMPMTTEDGYIDPRFLGKAFLMGGGAGIWGDFLFSSINSIGQGPQEVAAGPIVGLAGDTIQLLLGDLVQLSDVDNIDEFDSKTPERLVEFLRRYHPGANLWWAYLPLQRMFWDRMEDMADPKAYRKRKRRMNNREETYGNENWWEEGEPLPDRLPQYQER